MRTGNLTTFSGDDFYKGLQGWEIQLTIMWDRRPSRNCLKSNVGSIQNRLNGTFYPIFVGIDKFIQFLCCKRSKGLGYV